MKVKWDNTSKKFVQRKCSVSVSDCHCFFLKELFFSTFSPLKWEKKMRV